MTQIKTLSKLSESPDFPLHQQAQMQLFLKSAHWAEKKQMQRYIDRLRLELQRCVQKHRYNFHHPELVALSQYVDRITDVYRAAFEAKMQTWLRRRYQRPLRELRALALQRGISPAGRTRLQLVQAIQESEKHAPCYGSAAA